MGKQGKPLRDWTLGETMEYCKQHGDRTSCSADCLIKKLCKNHPWRWDLKDQPRFTEDEVATMRVLYAAGARYIAKDSETMQWMAEKPEWNENIGMHRVPCGVSHMLGYLPDDLFPSIRPEQKVELAEIVGR